MPVLCKLELDNFKSYREERFVDWKQFSIIFGHNGSGKSTLVDAIKFSFCFSPYNNQHFEKLKKEVCPEYSKDCSRSSVKITFDDGEKESYFERILNYDNSRIEYFFNNFEVPVKEYQKHLLQFNVNSVANSFLIEQHFIENIAVMKAKERSELFENLSGSIAFKSDYIKSCKELKQLHLEIEDLKKDLKSYSKQNKNLTETAKELKRKNEISREFNKLQNEYFFMKLFKIDKNINELIEKKNYSENTLHIIKKMKKSTKHAIEKYKRNLEEMTKNLYNLENKLQNEKEENAKYLLKISRNDVELSLHKKRMAKLEENLDKARRDKNAQENIIHDLEIQLNEVKENQDTFVTQSQKPSIQLEDQAYMDYLRLKSDAQIKSAKETNLLDSIDRERNALKDKLENFEKRKKLISDQVKRKELQLNNLNEQINCIKKKNQDTIVAIKDKQEQINKLEIDDLLSNAQLLTDEIENLTDSINEIELIYQEDEKFKKKNEIVRRLQDNFEGVKDRLKNCCDVKHERYKVAVTKIMGNKMDNIVVDTVDTAVKCINFIKNTYRGNKFSVVETFLPINNIKTKSLDQALRIVQNEPNLVLALDIMKTKSDDIKMVLHHVLGNVIICNTDDKALDVSSREKINCVSLNGTLYRANGIFSGGLASLLQKSKSWDVKEREKLRQEKHEKTNKLKKIQMELREKQELKYNLHIELSRLQERLEKYIKPLYREKLELFKKEKEELTQLQISLASFQDNPEIKVLQEQINIKDDEYEKVENRKNEIEDEVFREFCQNLNISNIRQYEEGDFIKGKERENRKKEYENLINKIESQIEYERTRDTTTTIKKLEIDINNEKKKIGKLERKKSELQQSMNKDITVLKEDEVKSLIKEIDEIKKNLKDEELKYKSMESDIKSSIFEISGIHARLLKLRAEKHNLLKECKIRSINIPLCHGKLKKVTLKDGIDIATTESSSGSSKLSSDESELKEKDIEIDYSKLSDSIKNLETSEYRDHMKNLQEKLDIAGKQIKKLSSIELENCLDLIKNNLKTAKQRYYFKLKELKSKNQNFEKIKTERRTQFNNFFEPVASYVDIILKRLYGSDSAQANIYIKNLDEPYLGGIEFECIIPKKRCVAMENLSGGEKAMCALALTFAINKINPGPCFIFDEIDTCLDAANIQNVSRYFSELKKSSQIINVTHNSLLCNFADALIGVHIAVHYHSSYAIHVDANPYRK